jgi:voltage-gated potassium channel
VSFTIASLSSLGRSFYFSTIVAAGWTFSPRCGIIGRMADPNVTWRLRFYDLLEETENTSPLERAINLFLVTVIVGSVAAICLETLPSLHDRYARLLNAIEIVTIAIFTIDYLLRWWVAPEREATGAEEPWRARWHYALSAYGIIDLIAILPFYIDLFVPGDPDWLRVLRLLRLLKMSRYAPGLSLFVAVIRNESRPLLAGLLVMAVLLVVESGVMFILEREAQPEKFASIPHTMWWAIVTMATVGYGDVTPVTVLGKAFGGVVMIVGIAMFAVPAGILATGFATEIRKRDFVVTWHTVAKMPLFSHLEASRIAEITALLKRQLVPAQHIIVQRGEPADSMFFIMAGEVEVEVAPHAVRLGPGQYFGEIALLRDTVRTATVKARRECQLLALDAADFRRLLDAHPELKASIAEMAERRIVMSHLEPAQK